MLTLGRLANVATGQAPGVHHVAGDPDGWRLKGEIAPAQRDDLARTQARRGGETQEEIQLLIPLFGHSENLANLLRGSSRIGLASACRWRGERCRVERQPAVARRKPERAGHDRVDLVDAACTEWLLLGSPTRLAGSWVHAVVDSHRAAGHRELPVIPVERKRVDLGEAEHPE